MTTSQSRANSITSINEASMNTIDNLTLSGYSHLRHISTNTSHETFIAQLENTKQLVHIRVYALEYLKRNSLLRDRIERWALVSRIVKHKNIIQGISCFISDSDLFIVEEHCVGGDLLTTLDAYYRSVFSNNNNNNNNNNNKFPVQCISLDFVRQIMKDIMTGLLYLHKTCGIVHRAIKLENIFLDSNNNAKLGGLHISAAIPPIHINNGMLKMSYASKHYAAPEIVLGEIYNGELIDVWAAGVVLFIMLTGRFPFEIEREEDEEEKMLFTRICKADEVLLTHPALLNNVSDPLAIDLVRNMLRVNPKCRLTVEEVLEHSFLVL